MRFSVKQIKVLLAGFLFAVLWASASAATKKGLLSAQPFVIALARFAVAAIIMLVIAHGLMRVRLPRKNEWRQLTVYGLLNVSIYLGLYVLAMQEVSAGLGSLFVATNPVLISLIGSLWFKHPVSKVTVTSLVLCLAGMLVAAYPLLGDSHVSVKGVCILLLSMISYSAGALYFSKKNWNDLHILTINGWQTLIGGLFLLPFMLVFYEPAANHFDARWLGSVLWLAIPVSIGAVQLWLFLLRDNPVKASFWLFLCPIIGFIIAAWLMKEPISGYTVAGVLLVIGGLYLVQRQKTVKEA